MKSRTTLYLNRNIVDFLLSHDVNVSEIADRALLQTAIDRGYANIEEQIKTIEKRLSLLRKIRKTKGEHEALHTDFLTHFRRYLATGTKETHEIKAWLVGPGNREFSTIIGHPKNLTTDRIRGFIAEAYTGGGCEA